MRSLNLVFTVSLMTATFGMVLAAGCLDSGNEGGLDVAAVSILPQKEMVQWIAGDEIKVIVMVPEGQDPHGYSPTPGQLKDLVDADIYFKVGSGVEFEEINMDVIEETNPDMTIVDTSEGIAIISFDEHHGAEGHIEEETDNDADDHEHDGTDPHIWLSPVNMKVMASNVLNALLDQDPENEGIYRSNWEDYISRLNDTVSEIKEVLGPYEDREFLVYHPSWGYFGDDFDLIQLAIEDEGKKPGPQGISAIIDQAKEHNISVVFVSPQFDSSSADQIADEIGGRVVKVDPLAENYLENLEKVAEKMREGFS
jgi:zinc transport system substrate-binding protein